MQYDSTSFDAKYDLASALYKDKRYDKAEGMLMQLMSDTTRTVLERGEVSYNLGNTQFAQKKYKEALSSYRHAMRCNPNDEDAKFNYAFTKLMLKQQEQQQNQDNKDNQNQDQNQEDQGGQGQQNNQNQQNKNDKNNGNQNDQNHQQQPQNKEDGDKKQEEQRSHSNMNQAQQEALLQAIQAEEDKTQDKLKEKVGVVVAGGKNW